MMGGNSKFYSALGGLVMLRGLVCFFRFGGTGNHQGKSIIMGGLPTPCETMGESENMITFWLISEGPL